MKKRMEKVIALALAGACVLTGCSSSSAESSAGTSAADSDESASADTEETAQEDDGVFNVAISNQPASLDPTKCNDYSSELVANNLYDTLLVFGDDNSLQPGLAESWEKEDDLTYVYQIRQDVKFWDGNDMTTDDVVYSLTRHMDADNASLFAYMYAPVESIEKTGDYEITVHLSTPDTSFMYVFATMAGSVVEQAYVEEQGEYYGTSTGGVMATGPYKYDSWTDGSQLVFVKNEDYWDEDTQYVADTLEFDVIEDSASIALAMSNGQIDFYNSPSYDTMDQLTESGIVDIDYAEGLQNSFVYFNCSTGPFADVNVRKAAATAIDAAAIALAIKGEGYYTDAGALDVDPSVMGYDTENWEALNDELDSYTYDVEKAKEYLAASGYPDGFECTMPTCSLVQKESEAIQYYLGQIGITVNLETVTFSDFCLYAYGINRDDEGMRDYDLLAFAWFPDYADPVALLKLYYGDNEGIGGSNMAAYVNSDFDALIDTSAGQEGDERSSTMMEAYRLLNADCPGKMIAYFGPSCAINNKYSANMSSMWMWNYRFTKVTEK